MHPRLVELADHVDRHRALLLEAVAAVPESLRDRRPAPELWSVAEVLEHLVRVEQGVARLLQRQVERGRGSGLEPDPETSSIVGRADGFRALRGGAIESPDIVRPTGEMSSRAAEAALGDSRRALQAAMAAADGLNLDAVRVPHVVLGPLTLYEWILFVGVHEERHALQVRRIGARMTA